MSATRSFMEMYNRAVKPAPTTFLKRINHRHMLYLLKGMVELPTTYYKNKGSVAYIWMHEVCRTVLDRYTDHPEKIALYERTKAIASRLFDVPGSIFMDARQIDEPFFSYGLGDSLYNESPEAGKVEAMLAELLLEYNKANPREELDIIVFNTVVEKTLKINRSIG